MCLRCEVRGRSDASPPRARYRVLCVRVPAAHRPNPLGPHSRPDLLQSPHSSTAGAVAISHPPADQSDGFSASSQQRLNGTSCCARQTGGHARKRKAQEFDIGTALQKRDEPGLVTATTKTSHPIWAFPLLTAGSCSCRPRPAVERLGLITTCHSRHSAQYMSTCLSHSGP